MIQTLLSLVLCPLLLMGPASTASSREQDPPSDSGIVVTLPEKPGKPSAQSSAPLLLGDSRTLAVINGKPLEFDDWQPSPYVQGELFAPCAHCATT